MPSIKKRQNAEPDIVWAAALITELELKWCWTYAADTVSQRTAKNTGRCSRHPDPDTPLRCCMASWNIHSHLKDTTAVLFAIFKLVTIINSPQMEWRKMRGGQTGGGSVFKKVVLSGIFLPHGPCWQKHPWGGAEAVLITTNNSCQKDRIFKSYIIIVSDNHTPKPS